MQRGPTANVSGGEAALVCADLQQIWPEQSLSLLQLLGQLVRHRPSQQISPDEMLHSLVAEHDLGHSPGLAARLRHRPLTFSPGSTLATVVQHASPRVPAQSEGAVHALGHFEAGKQIFGL